MTRLWLFCFTGFTIGEVLSPRWFTISAGSEAEAWQYAINSTGGGPGLFLVGRQ